MRGDLFLFSHLTAGLFSLWLEQCKRYKGIDSSWRAEIENVRVLLEKKSGGMITELAKGDMKVDKATYDMFNKEVKRIDIKQLIESIAQPVEFVPEISAIKEQVTKGNRANFKMMQETIQLVEKLSGELSESRQKHMQDESQQAKQLIQKYIDALLELFDLLDLIRASAEAQGDQAWLQNTEQVVNKALTLLTYYGLEELSVDGLLFDGSIMEGIGSVSPNEIERELPKYAVYAVTQRGFLLRETRELIRKAKVITVY